MTITRAGLTLTLLVAMPALAFATGATHGGPLDTLAMTRTFGTELSPYVRLLIGLSLLSLIPAALVAMTSFTRIIVTLSFLRHALGMPETPPNTVLLTLALFLTFFTMAPTLEQAYKDGIGPFMDGKLAAAEAAGRGLAPLRTFMSAHVRSQDVSAVAELAHISTAKPTPGAPNAPVEVPIRVLVPAFMLSELRAAFAAGFIIFLPFLLIDLIVAGILMALGMMMVPPVSISLPLKVMLFVLIDGWSLLLRAIAGAYS